MVSFEFRRAAVEQIRVRIILRQTVAGTVDHSEQLWDGKQKIEDLRDEEKQQCLAEMTQYGDNRKGHPREVAKSVTDEHS